MDTDDRIKVVHICTVPRTLSFFTAHTTYLKSRGFDVSAISSPGKQLEDFGAAAKVPVFSVGMSRQITPARDIVALFRLWRRIQTLRPHVVHAFTPKAALLGIVSAWAARVNVRVYHMLGLPLATATGFRRLALLWSDRLASRLSHRVVCISRSVRDLAVQERLCDPAKIVVLGNGSSVGVDAAERFNPTRLDPGAHDRVRVANGIPTDALVVGYVGRIVPDKGIRELVEAWSVLREECPSLHLLIAGRFEPADPVEAAVEQRLREDPRIHLAGYVADMPTFYAALDLLTLPTYREGFGQCLLEAAAMQVPVVATRVSGCVDAVVDGVTGTLVAPRNGSRLADAIGCYLKSADLRQRHGGAARQRALDDFRPDAAWEALCDVFATLLKAQSAGTCR